jgi:deoxyinosine 3'endonuclease (endonuclease V)
MEEGKIANPHKETKDQWKLDQLALKVQLVEEDRFPWTLEPNQTNSIQYFGGVDISFDKNRDDRAIASLVVLDRDMTVVYEDY